MATGKGASKGTGGHGRRKLEGRGPTPAAKERPHHPARRRASAAARDAATSRPARTGGGGGGKRQGPASDELVAGRNAVVEALRASVPASTLYLATGLDRDDRVDEARKLALAAGVTLLEGARPELDRLTGGAPHQGIALRVKPFSYLPAEDLLRRAAERTTTPLLVALDGVTDPHNLGAVARSAAAFGADGLLVPERRSAPVTPAAWKASAGTLARLPVARVTNLTRALKECAQAGLMIAGLDGDGDVALDDLELADGPLVLVVGGEGRGMSRLVAQTCDVTVRIPLASGVESLNASVATGVALAAVARRRAGR